MSGIDQGMIRCLYPQTPHLIAPHSSQRLVCSVCGFLLSGAMLDRWQVTAFARRSSGADLYLAIDTMGTAIDSTRVLIKVITSLPASAIPYMERLRTLRHPHIQPLLGIGSIDSQRLYIALPYEERGSLTRYFRGETFLPLAFVSTILPQMADALQYLHQRQLTYGRLKLENCLLTAPMTVQLADLYYTLTRGSYQEPHVFLAPEQRQGIVEPASDQYALAMVIYVLLSGGLDPSGSPLPDLPARAGNTSLSLSGNLRSLLLSRKDLSPAVDQILQQALQSRSADRFPSVLSFASALQAAFTGTMQNSGNLPSFEQSPLNRSRIQAPLALSPGPEVGQASGSQPHLRLGNSGPQPRPGTSSIPEKLSVMSYLPGHTSEVTALHWGDAGNMLASSGNDQTIWLWRMQHRIGTPMTSITGLRGRVLALRWSHGGNMLAMGATDATLRFWQVAIAPGKQPKHINSWLGHDGQITALEWAHDDTLIATGGSDRTIRIWNIEGKMQTSWQAHKRGVTCLTWSPQSPVIASGGADRQIHFWQPQNGQKLHTCEEKHSDELRALAWSNDGRYLASIAGKKDTRICIWDGQSGTHVATLTGHTRDIIGLFWSVDSSWLASISTDGSLRLWSMAPSFQTLRTPFTLPGTPCAVAGSPEQNLLAMALTDMQLLVMQLE